MVDVKGPAIVAILLYLSTLSSILILYKYLNSASDVHCDKQARNIFPFFVGKPFETFLEENPELVIIDPDYLVAVQFMKKCQEGSSADEIKEEWKDLQWRFNLPDYGDGRNDSLTVGLVFSQEVNMSTLKLGNFELIEKVSGDGNNSLQVDKPLHYFLCRKFNVFENHTGALIYLHIVVFYPVEEYLWVGAIPDQVQAKLASKGFQHHYGQHEQIFDLLSPERFSSFHRQKLTVPNDISHFLAQLPTSRYLHCPPERTASWYAANSKFKANKAKEALELVALRDLKAIARYMKMEMWIACGTLLGWYRQCSVIPYTSDTDTATWAKYLSKETDMIQSLKKATQQLGTNMGLYKRFGEPTATMEICFYYSKERLDLFFVYTNKTHFLTPLHRTGSYTYNIYQPYSLCSVAFLGLKVLAPCETETVILTEYGPDWQIPDNNYDYISSPFNTGPWQKYNFSGQQHQYISFLERMSDFISSLLPFY